MFCLGRPSAGEIDSILKGQASATPSYRLEGATRDYHCVRLGSGEPVFEAAKRAVRDWEMMDLGWLRAVPRGREVALVIRHYGFWSVNVARILRVEEASSRYVLAYGTLPEHAESGEERFSVTLRADGSVWYEIEAFSRPRHWLARLGYPLTRGLQRKFARDSLRRMAEGIRAGDASAGPGNSSI